MMSEINYASVKIAHQVRECEEKKIQGRKRQMAYLVSQYLREEGYFETATHFDTEAHLSNEYHVCDNVDLALIVHEYEAYYYLRFQKYPKLCKRNVNNLPLENRERKKFRDRKPLANESTSSADSSPKVTEISPCKDNSKSCSKLFSNTAVKNNQSNSSSEFDLSLTVTPILTKGQIALCPQPDLFGSSDRILKPLKGYEGFSSEWKEFADIISKEIFVQDLNVHWDDIMGLEDAKRLLKEAVVYPTKYPELFTGILTPWKGLLLYGPPGTGKTLLAKAVATECRTTFFNISASSVVSKWRGDSEKLVRVLFDVARFHAPSTIFLDELDALASRRDGAIEHEASRRLKTELLVQLDGLAHSEDRVFLLATSNLPWELDPAMLRRLEKRILVDLPSREARQAMLHHHLPPVIVRSLPLTSQLDYAALAERTAGYSGSDIKLVCKETAMQAMRMAFTALESTDCDLSKLQLSAITTQDVDAALSRTMPSASDQLVKYRQWQAEYGST